MTASEIRGIEPHAEASNGEYYIYKLTAPQGARGEMIEWLGPFFPTNRTERLAQFVSATKNYPDNEHWRGAYYRRLPANVRAAIRSKGPAGYISRKVLARLSAVNSDSLPEVINDGGIRKRWVGIGWVEEGRATGREVEVTD